MKLKTKLFLSYFVLILLSGISLFWLIIEIRQLTTSLRTHVSQDVRSIIAISRQLQSLEDLNAAYILLFIPGKSIDQKGAKLETTLDRFEKNWRQLKTAMLTPFPKAWYDRFFDRLYRFVYGWFDPLRVSPDEYGKEIRTLSERVESIWREIDTNMAKSLRYLRENRQADARYLRDARIKRELQKLRQLLADLNRQLGRRGIAKSTEMARIAQKSQWVIIAAAVLMVVLSIIVAFIVSKRLTRPIPALKDAVNKVAIQNFDIHIKEKSNDEIGELAQAFEQMSRRLKETEAYKSAMLSQFTHEMKSPLGSVKQATHLLETALGENASQEQKRFLAIIKGNNENLQKMITNILHSASYESGRVKLNYKPVEFVRLVKEVLIYLSPMIKGKNIDVRMQFSKEKITGEADEDKIKEVVQNLVSNAVKFSDKGTTIDISVREKFPLIIFDIRDRGIGIPAKEIPYVFERMYRAANAKTISVKGTGLGLYIVSQIVRAHGGKIDVQSREGQGTRFRLTLPRSKRIAEEGEWLQ
ncbi:MAG TPA: HAMP domain-containing histidine kinase [Caldithrix abyssi]|uniref:histidine kinase n=1 Tax=Caldithrix abyssi TaxID=187145 RepID=A0A7V4U3A5_CALAY|nr:HAMP domain-containing histidine kinase [Caldithrix abyssi]